MVVEPGIIAAARADCVDLEGEEMIGGEPELGVRQVKKAAADKTGANEQDEGNSQFGDYQGSP